MAGTQPRPVALMKMAHNEDFVVSELLASDAGAHSPFGDDAVFPLPVARLRYRHPGPENRPKLAGGR